MDEPHFSVELHQMETRAWVGIVKKRGASGAVTFMSSYYPLSIFAFEECREWIREQEERSVRAQTRVLARSKMCPVPAGSPA